MVVRPPVEKWSRDELEEQFCKLFQNNYCLRNKYNDQEAKLKQFSVRLQRCSKDSDISESSSKKFEELQSQNQLLHRKLQLTKQQLLGYARPSSRLSRRSSPSINKWNRLPKVQSPYKEHKLAEKSSSIDKGIVSQSDTRPSSSSPPLSQEKYASDSISRPQSELKHNKGYSAHGDLQGKVSLIKLNKQLHEKTEEVKVLRWKFKNLSEQMEKLRTEHDRMVEEYDAMNVRYSEAQYELQVMQEKLKSVPVNISNENKIEREETEMLRKEVQTLKEANEKLIQNSLKTEPTNDREKELLGRIATLETAMQEAKDQNLVLVRELEHLNQRSIEAAQNYRQQLQQKTAENNEQSTKTEQNSNPESDSREPNFTEKFYGDICSLIDSRFNNGIVESLGETEEINKWKKMYVEIYAELEKTRNMLMVQNNINQQHLDEVKLINKNCEHYKLQYEQKLSEMMEKLEEKNGTIRMLENQMKVVAYSAQKPLEVSNPDDSMDCEPNEMVLELQKVVVFTDCLKELGTLHPNLFFSIEFFDFELQTTPIFYGTETELRYTTIYDIIVSNLFVHYIATEGILIELYHSQGASYKLCAVGSISLSAFLSNENATKLSGTLNLVSPTAGVNFASLFYNVSIKEELLEALILQKKRSTATIFCTLTEPDVNTDHNESEKIELIVKVHRCSKLDMLTKNKLSPSSYVTYEFYDFYPASTEVVHKNANPEFNSTKVWTLSNGPELIAYLRVAEICFAIMEEELNEKHSNKQLGYVIIPLYPLSHNNPIIGTFLITALNKEPTVSTLDVSIYWKYAITKPSDSSSVIESSEKPTVSGENAIVVENGHSDVDDTKTSKDEEEESSKELADDVTSASSDSSSSTEDFVSVKATSNSTATQNSDSVAEEHSSRTDSSIVDKISANQDNSQPQVISVDVMPIEASEVAEESTQQLSESSTSESTSESSDKFMPTEKDQQNPEDTSSPKDKASSTEQEPNESIASSEIPTVPIPQPRSNLKLDRKLSPLNLPEIKKPYPKVVEFKEPIKESISISGESSSSSSSSDTLESESKPGIKSESEFPSALKKDIPILSASKVFSKMLQVEESNPAEYSLTLTVGSLYISENSPLLTPFYSNFYVTVEWKFLDFPLEECETKKSLPLAREYDFPMEFNYETSYELNSTRIKLLRQWMELGNRIEFVIVGTDSMKKSDDLGVALLNLKEILNRESYIIKFYDINNIEMAKCEIEVKFSKMLRDSLES